MIGKWQFLGILFVLLPCLIWGNKEFSNYFENHSLRVDYLLVGNHDKVEVVMHQQKKEKHYGGSHTKLIDEYDRGTYRYRLFDVASGSLIFSKGFCPLFQEWQSTEEASKKKGSFYQVAIFPFPKKKCEMVVEERGWNGKFVELFRTEIDPKDYFILDEQVPDYPVVKLMDNGKPRSKVDVAILPEGYQASEMKKFLADAQRMLDAMFKVSPFKEAKHDFNVYAVEVPSQESGTDVPGEGIYRNTAFNSTFYTFDTPRYLTSQDMLSIHDAAAAVPYDHVYVLVNTDRYGGGGFYNYLSLTSVDDVLAEKVFIHEFGHGLAGLADEYYSSDVAYADYYNLEVEPWEPNITTLVDFKSKWAELIDEATPQPTPRTNKYSKTVGLFEGGGYQSKGIYSPVMDCRMKSNEPDVFCPVCERAIQEVIEWHCD